jgi:hypothetical protein
MPGRAIVALALLVGGLLSAGCGMDETPPVAIERILPAAGFPDRCRGVGLEAVLMGDPFDPRVTWLNRAGGGETPLVWPPGWLARFSPSMEVVDSNGVVRLRQGQSITGACLKGPAEAPGSLMMIEGLLAPG